MSACAKNSVISLSIQNGETTHREHIVTKRQVIHSLRVGGVIMTNPHVPFRIVLGADDPPMIVVPSLPLWAVRGVQLQLPVPVCVDAGWSIRAELTMGRCLDSEIEFLLLTSIPE